MHFFLISCWILLAVYAWIILRRWYAWLKMPQVSKASITSTTVISVLIPVRNEAPHILNLLHDLEQQSYPKQNFEVLVIDDDSEDETTILVNEYRRRSNLQLRLVRLQDFPGLQQKKAALTTGVTLAAGELIMQTDGDCRVNSNWLQTFAHYYEQSNARCLSGPVSLLTDGSLFTGMQLVEFASLVGIGGASIALGIPNMCNGANLAYSREAFIKVQGFAGNQHLASGDDEFLMHKLAKQYPGQVTFLKTPAAIVYTAAHKSVAAFLNQRVRWASKWPNYSGQAIKLLAVTVFSVNFLLFWVFLTGLWGRLSGGQVIALYSFKLIIDGLFLVTVLHFFNRKRYIFYLIPLQLVYIPYVLYTALRGLRGTYYWKGRRVAIK